MKEIIINGLMCNNCKKHVEEVLNSIDGVNAKVDLKKGIAKVKLEKEIDNKILIDAIEKLDYKVIEIR